MLYDRHLIATDIKQYQEPAEQLPSYTLVISL